MKLFAAVLLLLALSACWAEVVRDFTTSCPEFFLRMNGVVSPPTRFNGEQYKQICQTLNDNAEFATLYDTANRIPVYSAYRFYGRVTCERRTTWYIEPQLDDPVRGGSNMATESSVLFGVGDNQAQNSDYTVNEEYHKGHLTPVYHASSQRCAYATFTLTNAAPQQEDFNRWWFHYAEKPAVVLLKEDCIKEKLHMYVVTGVVPGPHTLNNRLRIPSHFWSAFCCLDNNNKAKHSGAYIGENHMGSEVIRMRVRDLENELTHLYEAQLGNNIPFTLFGGGCYTELTETPAKKPKCKNKKLTGKKVQTKYINKKSNGLVKDSDQARRSSRRPRSEQPPPHLSAPVF